MADVAKPVRRRIIPQQIITPTKSQQESEALSPLATATQQVEITDLKEHSAVAAELLGPGRKIYIDLAEYQREQKAVDWKELLKERGVKIPRPGRAAKDDALPGANRFAAPAREPLNPLARVILKLERTTGMNYVPGDDSDEEPPAQDAPADASSDSEPEGPEGEGAGTGADGEAQKEKDAGAKAGGKRGKREGGNDYDYMDDFIDDEEFIEMFEKADKRKLKYSGFFISQGTIDRTDELMEEAIPDKPEKGSRKRKADANGGDSGAPGASGSELDKFKKATAAGADGEAPMKKRRKKRAEGEAGAGKPTASKGLAKMGAGAGASTAGSPLKLSQGGSGPTVAPASEPRPPKPEMPPYNMSAEVAAAIAHLRALAAAEPPPPAAAAAPAGGDGDGDGKARKSLPAPIIDYLKSVEKIFHKECAGHKMACRTIVGELMSFLSDYSKKENLRLYVAGRPQRKPKETAPSRQDAEDLRALLATTVPIPPQQGEGGSDDDFMRPVATQGQELQPSDGQPSAPEADAAAGPSKLPAPKLWKAVPMATRKAVYAFMKGKLNGAQLKSPEGQAVVQETLAMFPPGSMDAAGVRTIFTQQRGKEQPAQAPAGTPAAAAGGTPQGPAAPAIAPGSAAAAPAELQKPGGLAAAAIAAGMQAAMAAAAQAPVPMPSNPPSKGPVPVGGTLQAGRMPTSTAQQVTQTAAQPLPAPAVALSGAPAQAPAASPAGQAQPVPGASAQPTAPPAAAAITRMSDDEIVKIGIKHGADEATLITILASPVANSSLYSSVVLRTLALAGPAGMSVQEMAFMAVQAGLATWDPSTSNVRNGLSRKTKLEHVAGIGNYKYALLCMPGVVETRQPKEPKVKAESAPSGSTATASLSNAAVPEAGVPLPAGAEQTDGAAENP